MYTYRNTDVEIAQEELSAKIGAPESDA